MAGPKSGNIQFRDGQIAKTIIKDDFVKIFAPAWVEQALTKLLPEFQGAQFEIGSGKNSYLPINKLSLTELVAIARNEHANVTGVINFNLYKNIKSEAIIALRDLVKHCVIVGKDEAVSYGGYPAGNEIIPLNKPVYICDLPALQFQQLNNTGRHVLISREGALPQGLLDKEIFESTVGEPKASYQEAQANKERFIEGKFKDQAVLFDTVAFQAFVKQDFVLAAKALNAQAKVNNEEINYKFLKYGAGFFADGLEGHARTQLSVNLAKGVLQGITHLITLPPAQRSQIKRIELPFFSEQDNAELEQVLNSIRALCEQNNIEFASTFDDALKQTSTKYITATTNCSDPHAPTGNEMNYGSVDAAIAENLRLKGNNFSPICNPEMGQSYIALNLSKIEQVETNTHVQAIQPISKLRSFFKSLPASAFASLCASTALCVGVTLSMGLPGGISMSVIAGLAIPFFPAFYLLFLSRDWDQQQQYINYKRKTEAQLAQLNSTQLASFSLGVEAAKTYKDQFLGWMKWPAYRAPNAFSAGMEAQIKHDEELIAKVKGRIGA